MEPQDVAGKDFLTGMRGYIREDVRAYLRAVSEELFRRDEAIAGLRHKLEQANRQLEAARHESNGEVDLDRATLVKLVGEEASAILSSADAAGDRIRFEAERYAASVRDGVGSTRDHLAQVQQTLGRLLGELRTLEEGPEPGAPSADVTLLGPDDDPVPVEEIDLDEGAGVESEGNAGSRHRGG